MSAPHDPGWGYVYDPEWDGKTKAEDAAGPQPQRLRIDSDPGSAGELNQMESNERQDGCFGSHGRARGSV